MRTQIDTDVRDRITRWLEEGQGQFAALLDVLNDHARLQAAVMDAEREAERLRSFVYENERLRNQVDLLQNEGGKLREELARVRGENERYQREREDIAASISEFMNGVLLRLRRDQP